MKYTTFQHEWIEIAQRLNLIVHTPYHVDMGNREIEVPVLLRGFGGRLGMLLVTDFDVIADYADRLVELGYGFSCLSEPEDAFIDEEVIVEVLEDWGWAGDDDPPNWYKTDVT